MAGGILGTSIGFDFDDPPDQASPGSFVYQEAPEEIFGDSEGVAGEERPGKG